jgi:hypothetical protein
MFHNTPFRYHGQISICEKETKFYTFKTISWQKQDLMIQYQGWESTEAIIYLTGILEVQNLNLGWETEYPEVFFVCFSSVFPGKCRIGDNTYR